MVELKLKVPDDFYKEEIRCDYKVSADMKKLWAVELDLLAEFDRVCRKYNITYYACGGTVLGAERHHGFIPWDDDVDVMMMRSEYDRLCRIGSKEFQRPYFFQTEYTDPGSIRGHAQLRNSTTTGIILDDYPFCKKLPFNQGIFIDIFPLDNIPDDSALREQYYKQIQESRVAYTRYRDCYLNINKSHGIRKAIKQAFYSIYHIYSHNSMKRYHNSWYEKFEKEAEKYDRMTTKLVGTVVFQDDQFQRSFLGEPVYRDFEFLRIPLPQDSNGYLNKTYGDWKKFVKNGSVHRGIIFDTDTPYDTFINQL